MILSISTAGYISIHAPREGGDITFTSITTAFLPISIHAPREGGDSVEVVQNIYANISIHAPREGGDYKILTLFKIHRISIHAPREGGDFSNVAVGEALWCISIHAPREGGDFRLCLLVHIVHHFNPRPPRGGRRRSRSV